MFLFTPTHASTLLTRIHTFGSPLGMTSSSGGAYRRSSMPYCGLKLTPVDMSTAAPKSINLSCGGVEQGASGQEE